MAPYTTKPELKKIIDSLIDGKFDELPKDLQATRLREVPAEVLTKKVRDARKSEVSSLVIRSPQYAETLTSYLVNTGAGSFEEDFRRDLFSERTNQTGTIRKFSSKGTGFLRSAITTKDSKTVFFRPLINRPPEEIKEEEEKIKAAGINVGNKLTDITTSRPGDLIYVVRTNYQSE